MKPYVLSLSFLALLISGINLTGCANNEEPKRTPEQTPVFDISMQGVNPAWFVRAMEGVDSGIHRVERYGELVTDSSELLRRSLEEMDRNDVRFGLLSHGAHKEAWHAAHPERFLLSFEPDLSLEDHAAAAEEFAEGVREGWANSARLLSVDETMMESMILKMKYESRSVNLISGTIILYGFIHC